MSALLDALRRAWPGLRKVAADEWKRRTQALPYALAIWFVILVISSLYISYHPKFGVADHIKRLLQEATGANIHITQFEMLAHAGGASIERLAVRNPQGFSRNDAMELNGISVKFDPASLRTGHLVIQELTIRKAVFSYETGTQHDNLRTLMRNAISHVDRLYNAPPKLHDQVSMASDPVIATTITIKTLRVLGGHVNFTSTTPSRPCVDIPIRPLEVQDAMRNPRGLSQQETAAELAMVLLRHGSRAADAALRQGLPRNAPPAR
ncbi:hypothetical protein [Ferrovibrio sp.]|uniref:hypothetical protein n=1 Tax=Ferrovibrio sp. TaxID=1917215 RepID=UPI003D2DCAC9